MIDRVEKQRIMGVLRQTGLWAEADQYREQARQRLRDDGKGKQEAVEGAWDAMAEKFLPLAGSTDYESLRPDIWKQSHPESIRTYRAQERRDRAERKQRRRSRRRAHMLLGRKIQDRLKHERAKKRGGGKPDLKIEDLQQAVCNLSDPALIAECDDIKNKIFAALPNNEYRCVFELLAENFTHEQIAEKLGVSVSTIGRRLMQY